ncbi:BrnA antitoxin family protein [candidate division KSB1 bacterium]|nr:BrnA antitoxin family protein [candidate division KSB1 bacterium]
MKNKPENIVREAWDAVESPALSDETLKRLKPVKEHHPERPKRVRSLQKTPVKIPVAIRLNPDIVNYFKSQGKGWQTKINDVLGEYVKHRSIDI